MSEIDTHFVMVCPSCSASVRINRNHIGQSVACNHCNHVFRAIPMNDPIAPGSETVTAGPSIQSAQSEDRIVIACPSCETTLRVRRKYIGSEVRCNHCQNTFIIRDPEQNDPLGFSLFDEGPTLEINRQSIRIPPETATGNLEQIEPPRDHIDVEPDRPKTDYEQLQAAYSQLSEQNDRLTTDLETIRADLGKMSVKELHAYGEERELLRAEIKRLRDHVNASLAEQTSRSRFAAEFEQRDADLTAARAECHSLRDQLALRDQGLNTARADSDSLRDQLALRDQDLNTARADSDSLRQQLALRDQDLIAARAETDSLRQQLEQTGHDVKATQEERGRLSIERQSTLAELEQLRTALREREQSTISAAESLRSEVNRLRQALELAGQTHNDDQTRLNEQRRLKEEQEQIVVELREKNDALERQSRESRPGLGRRRADPPKRHRPVR